MPSRLLQGPASQLAPLIFRRVPSITASVAELVHCRKWPVYLGAALAWQPARPGGEVPLPGPPPCSPGSPWGAPLGAPWQLWPTPGGGPVAVRFSVLRRLVNAVKT